MELEAPQVQHTKHPSSPSSVLPARMKRPCNLAYPPSHLEVQAPKPVSKPVTCSKQATAKRKANECVQNDTFVHDLKQWDQDKMKLRQLDPNFKVSKDPRCVRSVKHSICGAWCLMAAPYTIDHFKKHVSSCLYSNGDSGMKSLENFGIVTHCGCLSVSLQSSSSSLLSALSPSSSPGPNLLPCPGLTEKDNPSLGQYFTRTSVTSAGGEDLHSVARALFSDEFKNLPPEKKDIVRLKQKQTHTWSVDHLMKTIHAIGKAPCERNVKIASDGSLEVCK